MILYALLQDSLFKIVILHHLKTTLTHTFDNQHIQQIRAKPGAALQSQPIGGFTMKRVCYQRGYSVQHRIKLGPQCNFLFILKKYIFGNILTVRKGRGKKIRAALYISFHLGIPTSRLISQIVVRQQTILIFHSRHIPDRQKKIFTVKSSSNIFIICNYLRISEVIDTR